MPDSVRYVGSLRGPAHPGSESCVIGVSTGLLAAAAVALSPAVSALIPLAIEVVLIAFRLGLHVERTARNLEASTANSSERASWTYVIPNKTEEEAQESIAAFNREHVSVASFFTRSSAYSCMQSVPPSNQIYVSASNSTSVTISGPPSTLSQLFESSTSLGRDRLELPVNGPYHAHHLHNGVNSRQLMHTAGPKAAHILSTYVASLPIISTSSGQRFEANLKADDLFAAVIDDILKHTLYLGKVFDGCADVLRSSGYSKCKLVPIGPNSIHDMLTKVLQSENDMEVVYEVAAAKAPESLTPFGDVPRTSKKPKLAIVGMAGRFPNAADHEKFWDLLEAGLDVHKRVQWFRHPKCTSLTGFQRCPKIDSMSILTMIQMERSVIRVTLLTVASLTNLGSSTLDFSTCHHVRRPKQTQCTV